MRLTEKGFVSCNIDEDISCDYCPNASLEDCLTKLGQYEDIDENPEHLAKIKKALESIKKFVKSINLKYFFCNDLVILVVDDAEFEWQYKCETQEEYELLKVMLL